MKSKLLSSIMLIALSGCGTIREMNQLIGDTNVAIDANRAAIEKNSETIRKNRELIGESNQALEENRRRLEKINAS